VQVLSQKSVQTWEVKVDGVYLPPGGPAARVQIIGAKARDVKAAVLKGSMSTRTHVSCVGQVGNWPSENNDGTRQGRCTYTLVRHRSRLHLIVPAAGGLFEPILTEFGRHICQ